MLDDKLEADNFIRTLHIASCAQHIIHGALKECIQKTVWNFDKLLKSRLWLFNDSPAKREAYLVEGDTDKFPTRKVCFVVILALLTQSPVKERFANVAHISSFLVTPKFLPLKLVKSCLFKWFVLSSIFQAQRKRNSQ